MSNVYVFSNELFSLKVREGSNGVEFDVENVANNLGLTTIAKSGNEIIRWKRVNEYLESFGFSAQVGKGDFIPEQYAYLLGMKANNNVAVNFQKFIAFEVLPKIRKNKVYISNDATDQEIDNAVRFATPQKRRNALMDATIDGKDSIFNVYEAIKDYIVRWTANEKIKAYKHIERVLLDKKDTYEDDVAFKHKVQELLNIVAKDIDRQRNWQNGALKREMQKQIEELRQPELDEYFMLPIHGFSHNKQYMPLTKDKWVKTVEYKSFCDYFPYFMLPDKEDIDVDWNKPIKMYLRFDHMPNFDTENLAKSAIDLIMGFYSQNDNIVREVDIKANKLVDDFKQGKIYFYLTNVESKSSKVVDLIGA